jgi:hypothetical protein
LTAESIHVPASTVRRISGIAKLLIPVVLTAAVTSLTTTWGWIRSRTSVEEIRPLLTDVTIVAKAAQSQGFSTYQDVLALKSLGNELAKSVVDLHAQSEVDRAYSKSPRRNEYIDRARRFYARELERRLTEHPNNPAEAVRFTRLAVWRPDRDD